MRPRPRVRFNTESFGFIVGFSDGEIALAAPSAMVVLHEQTTKAELAPHLLDKLDVVEPFHLRTPPLLWLELTRRCNLTCTHCYIDGGLPRAAEMSAARWHEIIDEIADMGVWAVAFTGGEPTLHPELVALVQHARARDLLVGIATHGQFLDDELLGRLPRDGVIISVSVDDLHVGRRLVDSPAQRGMEAILRARSHGFLTNVMTNTNHHNLRELDGLMTWAEERGVSVRSVPFSPLGRGKQHLELENTAADVELAAQFWLRECQWEHRYHEQAGLCVGVLFNYGLSLAYMTRRCSSGRFLGYIAADGTVFPCTMCAAEQIFAAGSVASRSFAEVWRDEWEIRKYSWASFAATCEGCAVNDPRYYCASRCPAMSHARHGEYFKCGASEFEMLSTLRRTTLIEPTPVGRSTNLRVVSTRKEE